MRYVATAHQEADGQWYACVESDGKRSRGMDLAIRHARAMKAVLLAAKAWNREMLGPSEMRLRAAEDRLSRAQERLAKIEKEVTRG